MVASLKEHLEEVGLEAEVNKASLIDLSGAAGAAKINSYDLMLSSTKIDNPDVKTPVIVGVALLSGIGEDEVFAQVDEMIRS